MKLALIATAIAGLLVGTAATHPVKANGIDISYAMPVFPYTTLRGGDQGIIFETPRQGLQNEK